MWELTPTEAHDAWQAGEVTIVDVREQAEHDQTRVPGVALIPMSTLPEHIGDLPDGPLVIMCRSGGRSAQVAAYLTALGAYGEVANLDGGIIGWADEGLPYEGEQPRSTA
jgi:rhodanese-related sulfurtransferase